MQVFTLADDYSFGILQSAARWQWFVAKCSKMKSDFRHTPESVFDTFPWPQAPSEQQIDAVAALATLTGGLRDNQPVTAPGIPASHSRPEALLSGDCPGANNK